MLEAYHYKHFLQQLLSPIMIALLSALFALTFATDTLSWGMNPYNTRNIDSEIDKHNAHMLTYKWSTQLCGSILSSPLVREGRICIGDLGGCYTCMNETTGQIIFQKNVSLDYDLPPTALIRATPTYSMGRVVLPMFGRYGFLPVSGGVWLLTVDFYTGNLIWKKQVSTFFRALFTGSPTIVNGTTIIVPLSSNEEAETYVNVGYECCHFAGRVLGYSLLDGTLLWNTSMIPDDLVGVGKYSGAAIWSGGAAIDGPFFYVTTGNLYEAPDDAETCKLNNPTNNSCFDQRVLYDSIVKLRWDNGQIVGSFRVNEADTWNAACLLGGTFPGCPLNPGPDADFGNGPMLFKRGQNTYIAAGQKSGFMWVIDDNMQLQSYAQAGTGGASGGFQFGSSVNDKSEIFGAITGNPAKNWTLIDGSVINYGFWTKITYRGEIKWQTPSPTFDSLQGSVMTTNDIMFGATGSGMLCVLDDKDGDILWAYNTGNPTVAAPAINGRNVYWVTGPSSTFTPGSPPIKSMFYAFTLGVSFNGNYASQLTPY